jgi:signal transduction histidine kinase
MVGLVAAHVLQIWAQPLWVPAADLLIGWTLVGCGLIGAVSRPDQPAGRRLALAGFLWLIAPPRQWFGGTGRSDEFLQLDAASFALVGWSDAVLAVSALAFADHSPTRRRDRVMVVVLIGVFIAQTAIRVAARASSLFGTDLVDPDAIGSFVAFADLARIGALAAAGVLLVERYLAATPPGRRVLGPVLLAGAASCVAPLYAAWYPLSQLGLFQPVVEDVAVPGFWLTNALRTLVPIAMLVGIIGQRRARGAVAQALAAFGRRPGSSELERALAEALGDPSIRVLVRDSTGSGWVDVAGNPAQLPATDDRRMATMVSDEGGPNGALVHDRSLAEDPMLVAAGVSLLSLVLDNAQLSRDLRRQLDDVRESRVRIVEAGDAERHRIERDLHDGVQQRLLALALRLQRASVAATADPGAARALEGGAAEALEVVQDVRGLAQGIHPTMLTDVGLSPALRALAARSPVPVLVDIEIDGPVPPSAAAAAYFVASEALANVVKHAGASTVRLGATELDGAIRLWVEDDGRGGADALGNGFRGLDDRIAAVGGSLSVMDRAGGGTIVAATIPVR